MVRRVGKVKQSKRPIRRPPQRSTRQTLSYEIRSYFRSGAAVSDALVSIGTNEGLFIDFTDDTFADSTGIYGSAVMVDMNEAEVLFTQYSSGVGMVIDFTDEDLYGTMTHNGSAYIGATS